MTQSLDALWEKVRAQKTRIPSLYGDIDFDVTPERFTDSMDVRSTLPTKFARGMVSMVIFRRRAASP